MKPGPEWYRHAVSALMDRQPGAGHIISHWQQSYVEWRLDNLDVAAVCELLKCERDDIVKLIKDEWMSAVIAGMGDAVESLTAMRH